MAGSKPYTGASLVKWQRVAPSRLRVVTERLTLLRDSPPERVARLWSFGLTQDRLRLELERVPGRPLHLWLLAGSRLAPEERLALRSAAREQLREAAARWVSRSFVHGDLSPRNILVGGPKSNPELTFIDWTVDLGGFEATPAFAAPEVFRGRRSCESDRYAIEQILCIVDQRLYI